MINSKEIISFYYEFNTKGLIYLDNRVSQSFCEFSLEVQGDEVFYHARVFDWNDKLYEYEFMLAPSTLDDLQRLIEEEEISKFNGINELVHGLPGHLGAHLDVKYASGEYIRASDNRSSVLDEKTNQTIYSFFRNLAKEEGEDFLHSEEEIRDFQKKIAGLWGEFNDSNNPEKRLYLVFKDDSIRFFRGKELLLETSYYREFFRIYNAEDEDGSFGFFESLEWRDGWIIGHGEKDEEIKFVVTEYEGIVVDLEP